MIANVSCQIRSPEVSNMLAASWLRNLDFVRGAYRFVVNPKCQRSGNSQSRYRQPHPSRLMCNFSEMVQECPSEPATNQRANPNRQKRKTHIRALLARRCQAGDVFVISRGLGDFAEGDDHERGHGSPDMWMECKGEPSDRGDQRS